MIALLLCAPLLAAAPDVGAATATLLTDVVSASLGRAARFDVITVAEMRKAVAIEGDRQAVGCTEGGCLAELAGAAGARWIVFGNVGALGDDIVLTLQLYDSSSGTVAGRAVWRAADVKALADRAERETSTLFAATPAPPEGARQKVLVLDLTSVSSVSSAASSPPRQPESSSLAGPLLTGAGVLALAAGAGLVIGAFVVDGSADNVTRSQRAADADYGLRDGLFVGGVASGGAAVLLGVSGAVVWGRE